MKSLQPSVATALNDMVRSTGTKDSLAQPVIDDLVKLGQRLRLATPNTQSPDEIQAILTSELEKAHAKGRGFLNPLVTMDGMASIFCLAFTNILL